MVCVWINHPVRIGFWVTASSVIFGLVVGLLLLGSRSFAKLFFAIGKTIAPKLRDKLEKLRGAWVEMHNYFGVTKSN